MGGKAIDPQSAIKLMHKAGVKPLVPFTNSKAPWKSKCQNCDRVVTPSYLNVRNGHAPCRYCAKGGVSQSEALTIAKKLNMRPVETYPGFKKPWKCTCGKCGREITPRLSAVIKTEKACNFCNRREVDPDEAEQVARDAGAIPLVPYPGARQWKCRCKQCKKVIYPTLRRMRNGQNPCGWCARVRIDPKEARQTFLDASLKPIGAYPGANRKWKASCLNCGERVERTLASIQSGRYACAYCAGRKLTPAIAKAILIDSGAIPVVKYEGIYNKWESKCAVCFRKIFPTLSNVRSGHSPCQYCSGRKVDPESAREFALTRALEPLSKYPGATKRWRVKCLKCLKVSTTSWVSLQLKRENSGCSSCTIFGFKPHEPAYLYLITHPERRAHKVGIGNTNAKRIEKHLSNGWEIYKVLEYRKGTHAHRVEQSVIEWLRVDMGLGPAYRSGDGWTETVSSREISIRSIDNYLKSVSGLNSKPVRKAIFLSSKQR